jgi:RHS repeat-associated protein
LITGTSLGNITDSWSYNGFGEIDTYSAAYSEGGFYSVHYTRDKLGRIIRKEETNGGNTSINDYVYDLAGRLTEVKQNGATSAQYTYDDNGNRLSAAIAGKTITGTYDNQDRLSQYGSTTYAYSGKGELLSKTEGGQITAYQYDSLGNLTGVTLPGGTRIDYAIDGSSRRIGKKVNGNLVQGFLYINLLKPVAELDGDGNVVAQFIYGSKTNVPDYMVKGGNTYRIISDDLGSPQIVIDVATGTIAQQMDYDEFGNVMQDTSPGFQPFGFAGGFYDRDTGLVQHGARDYDPETGRWTSKDPIGFAASDTNLYAYVQNDPVNLIDPIGLKGGNMAAPSASAAVLLAVGGGLTASDLLVTAYVEEMFEEIMNAIGDWLIQKYIQEGYDPMAAIMMARQDALEQALAEFQPGLNLPQSPPIVNKLILGEVLR